MTREQLQSIEWSAEWRYDYDWTYPMCPACEGLRAESAPERGDVAYGSMPAGIGHSPDCWLANTIAALRAPAVTAPQPTGVVVEDLGVIGIDFDRAKDRTVALTLYPEGTWGWSATAFGQSSHGRGVPLPPWAVEAMRAPAVTGEAELRAAAQAIYEAYGPADDYGGPYRQAWERLRDTLAAPPAAGAPSTLTRYDIQPGGKDHFIIKRREHGEWVKHREASAAIAGAPPALVALVQEWQRLERINMETTKQSDNLIEISHAYIAAQDARKRLLAWSPAPAPVAPPAELRADALARKIASEQADMHAVFAPPAVAGGDAPPEIQVGDDVTANSFPDVYNVSDSDLATYWNTLQRGRVDSIKRVIWRRRQEGQ